MNPRKSLVLDANILIRSVLGQRVRQILEQYEDSVMFFTPDVCFQDARNYLPALLNERGIDAEPALATLTEIGRIVRAVDASLYEEYEHSARERIKRDQEDWPIIAVAMLLGSPVWTEDQDFFGTGISVWTTDRVELYLRN